MVQKRSLKTSSCPSCSSWFTKSFPFSFALLEIVLIFVVFFLLAAWPVPDVNETHYLTRAAHFWDADWCKGDFFLESSATHWVFYAAFGWMTLIFPLPVVAWIGRILTWSLLAWSWRRLSVTILPARWWSVATAMLFVFFIERFQMAGEWVVGGFESKGFAFVLVFLGLEQMIRRRWNMTWILFGAAAMIHVLVGGWAVVAAAIAWLFDRVGLSGRRSHEKQVMPLKKMIPGLVIGGILALPGLIPVIMMSRGVPADVVDQANQIQVFIRLGHHLNPGSIRTELVHRFALLLLAWLVLRYYSPKSARFRLLNSFIAGSVLLAVVGIAIGYLGRVYPSFSASLLRFYWLRLADIMVPLGVAICGPAALLAMRHARPRLVRGVTLGIVLLGMWFLGGYAMIRPFPAQPRFYRLKGDYSCWVDACRWVADSKTIPKEAVFLTPRRSQTFRWYAHRPEVANWKDIPQDPLSVQEWWRRMLTLHATGLKPPKRQWYKTYGDQGADRVRELGRFYGASYVITESTPPLDLPLEYRNADFSVYRLE